MPSSGANSEITCLGQQCADERQEQSDRDRKAHTDSDYLAYRRGVALAPVLCGEYEYRALDSGIEHL